MKPVVIISSALLLAGCAGGRSMPVLNYESVFRVQQAGLADLDIENEEGAVIRSVMKSRAVAAGAVDVTWDGQDGKRQNVPPGTYELVLKVRHWELRREAVFGGLGAEPGRFLQPEGLSAHPQGSRLTLAVADTGNNRVQLLMDTGVFLQSMGQFGVGEQRLNQPTDVAWDGQILTVCDSQNRRLAMYDAAGSYQGEVRTLRGRLSSFQAPYITDFLSPTHLCMTGSGVFWVSDRGRGVLVRVTSTGGVLDVVGDQIPLDIRGPFVRWSDGDFWVQSGKAKVIRVDEQSHRLRDLSGTIGSSAIRGMVLSDEGFAVLSDEGRLLFLDEEGRPFSEMVPEELRQPGALAIWKEHLFVVDLKSHKVIHYRISPVDPEIYRKSIRVDGAAAPSLP